VFDRGYKIYPELVRNNSKERYYKIVVEFNKSIRKSKELYKNDEWGDVVWDIYNQLYNKHLSKK